MLRWQSTVKTDDFDVMLVPIYCTVERFDTVIAQIKWCSFFIENLYFGFGPVDLQTKLWW